MAVPRTRWAPPLAVVILLLLLAACGSDPARRGDALPDPGGPDPTHGAAPDASRMDAVETAVADRLAGAVGDEGLTLQALECPERRPVHGALTCTGWFDDVPGTVRVWLHRRSGTTTYDARLVRGVLATSDLVAELEGRGARAVDCGSLPAYSATVGLEVRCLVGEDGRREAVVARVTSSDGMVEFRED